MKIYSLILFYISLFFSNSFGFYNPFRRASAQEKNQEIMTAFTQLPPNLNQLNDGLCRALETLPTIAEPRNCKNFNSYIKQLQKHVQDSNLAITNIETAIKDLGKDYHSSQSDDAFDLLRSALQNYFKIMTDKLNTIQIRVDEAIQLSDPAIIEMMKKGITNSNHLDLTNLRKQYSKISSDKNYKENLVRHLQQSLLEIIQLKNDLFKALEDLPEKSEDLDELSSSSSKEEEETIKEKNALSNIRAHYLRCMHPPQKEITHSFWYKFLQKLDKDGSADILLEAIKNALIQVNTGDSEAQEIFNELLEDLPDKPRNFLIALFKQNEIKEAIKNLKVDDPKLKEILLGMIEGNNSPKEIVPWLLQQDAIQKVLDGLKNQELQKEVENIINNYYISFFAYPIIQGGTKICRSPTIRSWIANWLNKQWIDKDKKKEILKNTLAKKAHSNLLDYLMVIPFIQSDNCEPLSYKPNFFTGISLAQTIPPFKSRKEILANQTKKRDKGKEKVEEEDESISTQNVTSSWGVIPNSSSSVSQEIQQFHEIEKPENLHDTFWKDYYTEYISLSKLRQFLDDFKIAINQEEKKLNIKNGVESSVASYKHQEPASKDIEKKDNENVLSTNEINNLKNSLCVFEACYDAVNIGKALDNTYAISLQGNNIINLGETSIPLPQKMISIKPKNLLINHLMNELMPSSSKLLTLEAMTKRQLLLQFAQKHLNQQLLPQLIIAAFNKINYLQWPKKIQQDDILNLPHKIFKLLLQAEINKEIEKENLQEHLNKLQQQKGEISSQRKEYQEKNNQNKFGASTEKKSQSFFSRLFPIKRLYNWFKSWWIRSTDASYDRKEKNIIQQAYNAKKSGALQLLGILHKTNINNTDLSVKIESQYFADQKSPNFWFVVKLAQEINPNFWYCIDPKIRPQQEIVASIPQQQPFISSPVFVTKRPALKKPSLNETPFAFKCVEVEHQDSNDCGYHAVYNGFNTAITQFFEKDELDMKTWFIDAATQVYSTRTDNDASEREELTREDIINLINFFKTKYKSMKILNKQFDITLLPDVTQYEQGGGLEDNVLEKLHKLQQSINGDEDFVHVVIRGSMSGMSNELNGHWMTDIFYRKNNQLKVIYADSIGYNKYNKERANEFYQMLIHMNFESDKQNAHLLSDAKTKLDYYKILEQPFYNLNDIDFNNTDKNSKQKKQNRRRGSILSREVPEIIDDILDAAELILKLTKGNSTLSYAGLIEPSLIQEPLERLQMINGNHITVYPSTFDNFSYQAQILLSDKQSQKIKDLLERLKSLYKPDPAEIEFKEQEILKL